MNSEAHEKDDRRRLSAEASTWLARRDRGLTAAEQDEFFQWLRQDPTHRKTLVGMERTWRALDTLVQWQPSHSVHPNPDLLAPAAPVERRRRHVGVVACSLLAAVMAFLYWQGSRDTPIPAPLAQQGVRVIPRPESHLLPDGSAVTMNSGARFALDFSAGERRLRLLEGELHVAVKKNPERPFVVEVDNVSVRAVGTAFNVRRGAGSMEVLVTEGKVQIEQTTASADTDESVPVAFGEKARVDLTSTQLAPAVTPVSVDQISRELAWQGVRLEFDALPLAAVVEEFNLRNARKISIGDAETGRLRVSGTFQADQVEAFVRLLTMSYALEAETAPDGVLLIRHGALRKE